ncbi:hypothetical protein D3C85_1426280 [compost metagenome]
MQVHAGQIRHKYMLKSAVKAGLKMHGHSFRYIQSALFKLFLQHSAAKQRKDFPPATCKYRYNNERHGLSCCLFMDRIGLHGLQSSCSRCLPLSFPALSRISCIIYKINVSAFKI